MEHVESGTRSLDKLRLLKILISVFDISLNELSGASKRQISKAQLSRILNDQKSPSAKEKAAISIGINAVLMQRSDSAYLFGGEQ